FAENGFGKPGRRRQCDCRGLRRRTYGKASLKRYRDRAVRVGHEIRRVERRLGSGRGGGQVIHKFDVRSLGRGCERKWIAFLFAGCCQEVDRKSTRLNSSHV